MRIFRHEDIRTKGSGNIGASNVWRVYGAKLGLPAMLLDTAKGFVPAYIGVQVAGPGAGVLAGAAAMLGHWRPLFLGFQRGGKMVATAGGAFLGVAPLVGFTAAGVWLLVFAVTRYPSVASIIAAGSLGFWAWFYGYSWPVIAFGVRGGTRRPHPPLAESRPALAWRGEPLDALAPLDRQASGQRSLTAIQSSLSTPTGGRV